MTTKKPGDETIKVVPGASARSEDSFVGGARTSISGIHKAAAEAKAAREAAPEVSQGAWRERAYTARTVMSKDEVVAGLQGSLRTALGTANHPRVALDAVRQPWLPLLRQALEQGAGDGLDAWLSVLFAFPGQPARQPLFTQLGEGLMAMRAAKDLGAFEQHALQLIEHVTAALGAGNVKLSFKEMEKQLEGKLEVDELLLMRASLLEELQKRVAELGNSMTQLREQMKRMPGKQPSGLYASFVRIKAEFRVLEGELHRREGKLTPR